MRVRRLIAMGVALAVTPVAFLLGASPASAQGYCPKDMAGWVVLPPVPGTPPPPYYPSSGYGQVDAAAEVVVWARSPNSSTTDLMVQFRNLQANGKSGLVGMVGRAANTSDLGITGSIGAAPDGAWCSDILTGSYIWSSLTYQAGGVTYTAVVDTQVTTSP